MAGPIRVTVIELGVVQHPITEMITQQDLVQWQLEVRIISGNRHCSNHTL